MVSLADYNDAFSSLDETSSLSSSATTTTTSSSISSSTHCDLETNGGSKHHSRSPSQSKSCRRCANGSVHHNSRNSKNSGSCCPPATPTHGPKRGSPRKVVKNSCIQTDSPSLAAWKLSHEQQLMAKANRTGSLSDAESFRSKIFQNERMQPPSTECQSMSGESLRSKCPVNHHNTNYDDIKPSSLPSSSLLSGGKAVAIIKGTPVQGKISNCTKINTSKSKNCCKSSFSYGDSIYSDSECVKYSCITSPVRSIRSGMSTMPSRSTIGHSCNGSGLNDTNVNGYFTNPWSKRNCYSLQRSTLTEEYCREADRRCDQMSRKNAELSKCPPTPTRCPTNKCKLQTFSSGNSSSNHSLGSPYSSSQAESTRKQNSDKSSDLHSSALSLASNSTIYAVSRLYQF